MSSNETPEVEAINDQQLADCVAMYDALTKFGPIDMAEYKHYCRMLRAGSTRREVLWRIEMDYRNRGLAMGRNLPPFDAEHEDMRELRTQLTRWQRYGQRVTLVFLFSLTAAVAAIIAIVFATWAR